MALIRLTYANALQLNEQDELTELPFSSLKLIRGNSC